MYDIIIIGAGPAGLTAAIYARRAGYKTLVFEAAFPGGQMTQTPDIENYPGFELVTGFELSSNMHNQAASLGAQFITDQVLEILPGNPQTLRTSTASYQCKSVILAMGAYRRTLDCPGEAQFTGRGVSYCATCDGGFFRGKTVCIVGGGDTALEDAIYLSNICERVYLIHRRDQFRAKSILQSSVKSRENIQFIPDSVVTSITGDTSVKTCEIKNVKTGQTQALATSAVFVAVGTIPKTDLAAGLVDTDKSGFIMAGEDCKTSRPGIMAAGDLRTKPIYQIVTATADGATAIHAASQYIDSLENS